MARTLYIALILSTVFAANGILANDDMCRPEPGMPVCNGRGDCIEGECICWQGNSPEEIVVDGDFCECDNFSCPRYNGKICSGPDHGECVCGRCMCRADRDVPGYDACECPASQDSCIAPDGFGAGQVCSGMGECVCGECQCYESEEGMYSGKFCQECPTCPTQCETLTPIVQCSVFATGPYDPEACGVKGNHLGYVYMVENLREEALIDAGHTLCTFIDDDDCRASFAYKYEGESGIGVIAKTTKECRPVDTLEHLADVLRWLWYKVKEELGRPCPRE